MTEPHRSDIEARLDRARLANPRPARDIRGLLNRARLDPNADVPAEQPDPIDDYETGRTYTSAEISQRVKHGTPRMQPTPAMEDLTARLLAEMDRHDRETIARRALASDPNPTDTDPHTWAYAVAEQYDRHADNPTERAALLDSLANELTLDDIRAIRTAAEIAAKVTPRVIQAADANETPVPKIAANLGVTESYVYRVLREQRAAQAAPTTRKWARDYTRRHNRGEHPTAE